MNLKQFLLVGAWVFILLAGRSAMAQDARSAFVRLADLEIAAAHVEAFRTAAAEHALATLGTEAGALALHSAAEKGSPTRVRVFEMYRDEAAYQAHLQTPHFQKFRAATASMIVERRLYDAVPILLGSKPQMPATAQVRVAELEIAPARLDAYKAEVTQEIDASIRLEPGVLAIYAVALTDKPTHLRFFEIYADEGAYRQHIESPHFKKYVGATQSMITARKLFEMEPLSLGAKPR
jgi:quinol monooxygenase YgiN